MEGFLRYKFVGLIFGGAYTRRGLFLEFYDITLFKIKGTNLQTKKDGANLLLIFNLDDIATFLDPFNLKNVQGNRTIK